MSSTIAEIELHVPNWWVLYVAECDAEFKHKPALKHPVHTIVRHYPGHCSTAMLAVINCRFRPLLHSIEAGGRGMRVSFSSHQPKFAQHYVFLHGGHGQEFAPSLADAAVLLRQCKREAAVVMLGDLNVDLLPTLTLDPFAGHLRRGEKHMAERMLYYEFLRVTGLKEEIPGMVGNPGGAFGHQDFNCAPISRVPLGDSSGLPALLDHYAHKHCEQPEGSLSWHLQSGDHAFLCVRIPAKTNVWRVRPRSTWRCCNMDDT